MRLIFKRFLPCFFFLLPMQFFAADWYVDNSDNNGDVYTIGSANGNDGAGGTALAPFATLAHAILMAVDGDNIFIDAGTYDEDAITLNKELNIQGAGYNLTIFDHNFGGTATDWFMYITADNVTLSNMQVIEYDNNGTQLSGHSGQAITIEGALNVLIEDVMLNGNGQSGGNPAVVIMSNSTVTLRGGGSFCNTAGTAYTGGVEAFGDNINLLIEDYILGNNYKDGGFDGGGLRVEGDATTIVTVNNSRIANNIAVNGGGIAIYNGVVSLNNCIIEGNEVGQASDPVMGGGIYISCGTLNLTNCIIRDNIENASGTLRGGGISARYNGTTGAFSGNRTIAIVANTCIFENNSGDNGTDIYGANGFGHACDITLNDCIFSSGATNIRSDATSPASSVNVTYVGALPTFAGANISSSASAMPIFDLATVTPPDYSGACPNIILCNTPAPTGDASQSFCIANAPTLASIVVVGTTIQWYDAPVGGNLLPDNTVLVDGVTYYASQTAGLPPCESLLRLAVTVNNETNGFGAFATATRLNANGSDVIYNTSGAGADCINPDCLVLLNGTNFGAFDANSADLVLTAAEIKTFKTLGFVCSASMSYRVYRVGDAPGAFNNVPLPLNCGCNAGTFADGFGPCSPNDQKWNDFLNLSIDLTSGICEGNYLLEVFYSISGSDCIADGSDCTTTKLIDNGGLFYVANFSINATPTPTGNANQDFCSIDVPTVTNLVAVGTTIQWYDAASGGNLLDPADTLVNGNYFATQTLNFCESSALAVAVTVANPAAPISNGNIIECEENPIQTLDANDALTSVVGVTWYDAASGGNVVASPTINTITSATFFAEFNDGSCPSTTRTSVLLDINDSPADPISNGDLIECEANPLQTLDANDALVSTVGVTWFDAATGGNVVATPTINTVSSATYFAEFTDGVCASINRTPIVLTINDSPNPPTSNGDLSECPQAPLQTLNANDALVSTVGVTWFDAATGGNVVATPILNSESTITYFAELNNGTCTSLTRSQVILTIAAVLPAPFSNGDLAECEQNPIQTLDANDALNGSLGVTWFDASSGGNVVLNPTFGAIGNTTYFAEFSDGACTSLIRTAVVLTINDSPNAPTNNGDITACEQNPIQTLDANNALSSTLGISWFNALSGGVSVLNPTLGSIGNVTYFAEFSDGTCSSLTRTPVVLTLNDSPNAPISLGNITECEQNPLQTLDANDALSSTLGVTWFDASTAGVSVLNPTLNTIGNETYFAEFSDGTCSSLTRTAVILTINDSPNAPISLGDITECEENPIQTLDANNALSSTLGISWFNALSGGVSVLNPTLGSIGNVTYFAEFSDGTCSSLTRTAVILTLNDSPNAPISSGNITECEQNPIQTLDANDALSSTLGVTWFDASTAGVSVLNPTLNTIGNETYFAEFSDGTCSSLTRTAVILTMNDSPNPPTSSGNITECEQNPIQTLNATDALTSLVGVTWFDAATAGSSVLTPTLNTTGSETYFAEFTNGTCTSLTRTSVVLTITAAPGAPTGLGVQSFCLENNPEVSDLVVSGSGIIWYDAFLNGNVIGSTIPLIDGGNYYASQTIGLCESIDRLTVSVELTDVNLNLSSTEQPLCGQNNGSIEVLASNGATPYTYTWADGTVSSQLTNVGGGIYNVSVVDLNGCIADLIVNLDCVIPDIPEIITPGKNGKNETWVITLGSIYPNMTVSIFNRWGNEVYKASPYLDDWDGKANTGVTVGDEYLPSGTYFYIIDLKNGEKPMSGYIELVR